MCEKNHMGIKMWTCQTLKAKCLQTGGKFHKLPVTFLEGIRVAILRLICHLGKSVWWTHSMAAQQHLTPSCLCDTLVCECPSESLFHSPYFLSIHQCRGSPADRERERETKLMFCCGSHSTVSLSGGKLSNRIMAVRWSSCTTFAEGAATSATAEGV